MKYECDILAIILVCLGIFAYVADLTNAFASIASTQSRFSHRQITWPILITRLENDASLEQFNDRTFIDPLIYNILQDEESSSLELLGGLLECSNGIRVWRHAFTKGRLPTEADFVEVGCRWWPREPLFSKLYDSMVTLQLPRFALRHPEVINVILLSILRMTVAFSARLQTLQEEQQTDVSHEHGLEEEDDFYFLEWKKQFKSHSETHSFGNFEDVNDEDAIAAQVTREIIDEWTGVVNGVASLDSIFGFNHGLLHVSQDGDTDSGDGATIGFGIHDGIWSHTGWKEIPKLQQELANAPQLKELVQSLGRRPSAKDRDSVQKFAPRKQKQDGAPGAEFDEQLRESIDGITHSGSLSEMLPAEALLLCGNSKGLRRLFLAKKVESKLLSYQLSGWTDVPSVPRTRPLYMNRLPSAPGGPIIVCLDTSWSMTGRRESLSKAVVLACVSVAYKQGRDCQVVAFSTERGVMEAGKITAESEGGIQRLLEFLSHSFGGGTDVTGALKFAIKSLEEDIMSAADILLVTDGEIPDPPISEELMDTLDIWKLRKGIEVHGLLIGKSESKPLSRICTTTHDFLSTYDVPIIASGSARSVTRNGRISTALFAKKSSYDDIGPRNGKSKKSNGKRNKWEDDMEENYDYDSTMSHEDSKDEHHERHLSADDFNGAVSEAVQLLRSAASKAIVKKSWTPTELEQEHDANEICWHAHAELRAAVKRVEDGLVERGEDARLVLLAMIASEHILLLGSPGTAKSILGLRLAELCKGKFFQRLLTRFTTPEELFGPLSLSSLERDEYRRCTEGFLPTADIAFLDEIFKANSAILNTLLTILNERKFDNAGGRESCPIRCVVGASNELPDNDDLVALFDRFLLRKEVLPVSDDGVLTLLSMSNPGVASSENMNGDNHCETIFEGGLDEVIKTLSSAAETVKMDTEACELMRDLRTHMRQEHNVEISDRRLVKATRLLKISAASDGRSKVDPIDFLLMQHCFWNIPEQRAHIREWLWENLTPGDGSQGSSLERFRFLLDNVRNEIMSALRKTSGHINSDSGARPEDLVTINALTIECFRISTLLQRNLDVLTRHIQLMRASEDFLWIDSEDASAIQQLLLPRAELLRTEMRKALEDSYALELSLSKSAEAPTNELRSEVIQELWEEGYIGATAFTETELSISMKEAKAKYDIDTFRRWKRAKRKAEKVLQ